MASSLQVNAITRVASFLSKYLYFELISSRDRLGSVVYGIWCNHSHLHVLVSAYLCHSPHFCLFYSLIPSLVHKHGKVNDNNRL